MERIFTIAFRKLPMVTQFDWEIRCVGSFSTASSKNTFPATLPSYIICLFAVVACRVEREYLSVRKLVRLSINRSFLPHYLFYFTCSANCFSDPANSIGYDKSASGITWVATCRVGVS